MAGSRIHGGIGLKPCSAGESVRARFPESHSGYAGAGAALRELGQFEEAEAVLAGGMERLPYSVDIAVTHAGIASMRRDWVEAARRWEAVRLQFPRSPSAYTGGAAALKALGRLDEADNLLAEGVKQCPERSEIAVEHACSAHHREDWAEAAQRWALVRERFPDNVAGRSGLEEARQQLQNLRSRPAIVSEDEFPSNLDGGGQRRKGASAGTSNRRLTGSARAALVENGLPSQKK